MTINNTIGNANLDFGKLNTIADGKYNMGEVQVKADKHGNLSLKKINNHVGFYAGKNVKVTTPEENRLTNMAVFKAILLKYGGEADDERVKTLLRLEISDDPNGAETLDAKTATQQLKQFENPFIGTAFKFLLTHGNSSAALSRDELRLLLNNLEGWEQKKEGYATGEDLDARLTELKELRAFKRSNAANKDTLLTDTLRRNVKGLGVGGISDKERTRVLNTSVNQSAASTLDDGLTTLTVENDRKRMHWLVDKFLGRQGDKLPRFNSSAAEVEGQHGHRTGRQARLQ